MTTTTTDLRIYVACLASYSSGTLHGAWIDCEGKDADDLQEEVQEMLAKSKEPIVEEYAIHDHEGFPSGTVGEFSSLREIAELVEAIEDADDPEAFSAVLGYFGDLEQTVSIMRNGYLGHWEREGDYAADFTESCGDIPEHLVHYIDYEKMERDWDYNGDICQISDGSGGHYIVDPRV